MPLAFKFGSCRRWLLKKKETVSLRLSDQSIVRCLCVSVCVHKMKVLIKSNLQVHRWLCLSPLLLLILLAVIGSEVTPTEAVQNVPPSVSATSPAVGKDNTWGYFDVRTGAHMFYWLYFTKAPVKRYTDRPLIIWLQGGPGASSCGHGNFEEIGPLDVNLNERNFTWTKDMNVLFIDNPVGSGFSFVDNLELLTKNNQQISDDLIVFMRKFMAKHPEFQTVPLYIFSESYGGKMAAEFALDLHKAVQEGAIKSNPKAVVFGDPWISPIDSMLSWAPFLFNNVRDSTFNFEIITLNEII